MGLIWNKCCRHLIPIVSLLLLLLSQAGVRADENSKLTSDAVDAIVQVIGRDDGNLNGIIVDLGIPPAEYAHAWAGWERWTTQRKLYQGYHWAEAHEAGSGHKFLSMVAHDVAQYNDAIRYHGDLKDIFPGNPDEPLPPSPSTRIVISPPSGAVRPDLPDDVSRIIDAIAIHTDGGYPGGMQALIERCCGYDKNSARDLLIESLSDRDGLARAILESNIPPELKEKILRALIEAGSYNGAIANDPALAHIAQLVDDLSSKDATSRALARAKLASEAIILPGAQASGQAVADAEKNASKQERELAAGFISPRDPPSPTVGPALPDGPTPTPGGGTSGNALFAENWVGWYGQDESGAPNDVTFDHSVKTPSGPGGIVLGEDVSSSLGTVKPLAAFWQSQGDNKSGRLAIILSDNTTNYSRYFSEEQGYAARAIVFGQSESGAVLSAGIARGYVMVLASLGQTRPTYALGSNLTIRETASGRHIVLNPAVNDLAFGKDLIIADYVPRMINETMIRGLLQVKTINPEEAVKLQEFSTELNGSGYRMFDRPMVINRKDLLLTADPVTDDIQSRLDLRRLPPPLTNGDHDNELSENAPTIPPVLTNDDTVNHSSNAASTVPSTLKTDTFLPAAPILIRAFPQLNALDDFAELAAIERWLKESGITQVKGTITLNPAGPVGGVVIGEEDANVAPPLITFRFLPPIPIALNDLSLETNSRAEMVLEQNNAPAALIKLNGELANWRRAWFATSEVNELALRAAMPASISDPSLIDIAARFERRSPEMDDPDDLTLPASASAFVDRDKAIMALATNADNPSERGLRSLSASPLDGSEDDLLARLIDPASSQQIQLQENALKELRSKKDELAARAEAEAEKFGAMIAPLGEDDRKEIFARLDPDEPTSDADMIAFLDSKKPGLGTSYKNGIDLTRQQMELVVSLADGVEKLAALRSAAVPGWQEWYALQLSFENAVTNILAPGNER